MLELELSSEDAAVLRETLEHALSELRYEIHNTDAHDYREKLRAKQACLEGMLGRLAAG